MIVTDCQPHRVSVNVYGEFTLADYREFEEAVNYKTRFDGPVDLLFDLSDMAGATLDVALEDLQFTRAHADDFHRIAVVTDSQWVLWSAWLAQVFMSAELKVFDNPQEAEDWLSEEKA
ncbi:MAG: STAS/SEC14 domain-containing protein [Zoogloeaceae bacterium]|jgi:hypothetical protein|nr:STAS/SEC14 domain-containing protein [Zoogloeaceae bacterium]